MILCAANYTLRARSALNCAINASGNHWRGVSDCSYPRKEIFLRLASRDYRSKAITRIIMKSRRYDPRRNPTLGFASRFDDVPVARFT